METVYEKRNVCLILGDATEVIRQFSDCYFDAIITDPPYGVGFDKTYDGKDADRVFFDLEGEFFRVLKWGGWFVFWWTIKKIPAVASITRFSYVWQMIARFEGNTRSVTPFGGRKTYAPVMVFSKGTAKVSMSLPDTVLAAELPQVEGVKIGQGDFKPTYTQAVLLSLFAGKGGRVLDPFAGFGSLLLASLLTGQAKVVGVEKDRRRFEVAKILLEEEFIPKPIPELMSPRSVNSSLLLFDLSRISEGDAEAQKNPSGRATEV